MVIEVAELQVAPERAEEFEAVFPRALAVLAQADGMQGGRLLKDVEAPGRFLIEAQWASVEHHTEGFMQSELFEQFRQIVGTFLQGPPAVRHFEVSEGSTGAGIS